MLRIAATIGSTLALALVVAAPGSALPSSAKPHIQQVGITFLAGDRVLEGNIALAAGVPVRLTVTNHTHEFHTFTVPGLHMSKLVPPARGGAPTQTTFTFTVHKQGVFAWHCLICPSGIHGKRHSMTGNLYLIIDPTALP
jgi:hypothetical protein